VWVGLTAKRLQDSARKPVGLTAKRLQNLAQEPVGLTAKRLQNLAQKLVGLTAKRLQDLAQEPVGLTAKRRGRAVRPGPPEPQVCVGFTQSGYRTQPRVEAWDEQRLRREAQARL
jgi:hypothetical protein